MSRGDKLLNTSKIYLAQDWLYVCGAQGHKQQVLPTLKELQAAETERILQSAGNPSAAVSSATGGADRIVSEPLSPLANEAGASIETKLDESTASVPLAFR